MTAPVFRPRAVPPLTELFAVLARYRAGRVEIEFVSDGLLNCPDLDDVTVLDTQGAEMPDPSIDDNRELYTAIFGTHPGPAWCLISPTGPSLPQ